MSTNYYFKRWNQDPVTFKVDLEVLHIGKSSAGWCFSLNTHPEQGIESLSDWVAEWAKSGGQIEDEYHTAVSIKEMMQCITERSWPRACNAQLANFAQQNGAEPGPRNLWRHKIYEGGLCIGHGSGTWDLMRGEFS